MTIDAEGIEGVGHYRNNRRPPRVVIAPDKFRGTATAGEVAGAIAAAATSLGWDAVPLAMSDGGEGFLDACAPICPHVVVTTVTGPDGAPIDAQWRHGGRMAVVEMARASGLTLAGGPSANDPVEATSRGTGELLIAAARLVGPTGSVVLGLGGSATTDGGRAAWEAVEEAGGLQGTTLMGAYDVDVPFADAAALFGPQKGAGPEQVDVLTQRLQLQADTWRDSLGIDVSTIAGGGAAGGMGGAVVMLGGQLRSGYRFVAELVGLTEVRKTLVGSLSTGWRQRLALGTAIIHRPRLLFLDEPTSGVDPSARRAFWDLIYKLVETGVTVLVSTHYMDEAEYCTRVGIMRSGRLLALDTPLALKQNYLQGDVWDIHAEPLLSVLTALEESPVVVRARLAGDHLSAITHGSLQKEDLEAVIKEAGGTQVKVEKVEANLEDVFLALALEG